MNYDTWDAVPTALHSITTHLKNINASIRRLCADFSTAFSKTSTMKPAGHLNALGLSTETQTVQIGSHASSI